VWWFSLRERAIRSRNAPSRCRTIERLSRRGRHDPEVHILRHAPDDPVCTRQRRAAAKDERERCSGDCRQGCYRPDEMQILFRPAKARQPEISLGFAKLVLRFIAQAAACR
jgi:hypothetical protein